MALYEETDKPNNALEYPFLMKNKKCAFNGDSGPLNPKTKGDAVYVCWKKWQVKIKLFSLASLYMVHPMDTVYLRDVVPVVLELAWQQKNETLSLFYYKILFHGHLLMLWLFSYVKFALFCGALIYSGQLCCRNRLNVDFKV